MTLVLQAMPFTRRFIFKEKKDMRQASSNDHEGPHESSRNRECSVKSFDTSLLRGSSIPVETATKWKNGRGKGN